MNAVDITTAIRSAVAHERAAAAHEDRYANQMKAAGASMYHAFTLALKGVEEFKGRKLDDKAIERIYKSTKPRPWWDAALAAAKFLDGKQRADRDHALRLIQWHLDPEGAYARRLQNSVKAVASRKRAATSGLTSTRKQAASAPAAPATEEMRALTENSAPERTPTVEDLLGEVNRISSAARKVEPANRGEALEALRTAARNLERYVP